MKRLLLTMITLLCAWSALAQYPDYIRWDTNTSVFYPTNFISYLDDRYASGTSTNGSGTPSTNDQGIVTTPGEITLRFLYSSDGKWAGRAGTIYVYAWDRWQMDNYPVYEETFTITAGADALQNYSDVSVDITEGMISQTWWYAWADMNADGYYNGIDADGGLNSWYDPSQDEPGALAEYAPLEMDSVTNAEYITFAMVDRKAATPRMGFPLADDWQYSFIQMIDMDDGGELRWTCWASHREFICEPDYMNTNSFNDPYSSSGLVQAASIGGMALTNGVEDEFYYIGNGSAGNWKWQVSSNELYAPGVVHHSAQFSIPNYAAGQDPRNSKVVTYGTDIYQAPYITSPAFGSTVDVDELEIIWTNGTVMLSAVLVQIADEFTNSPYVYDYAGYMENHHPDGTVRHRIIPSYLSTNSVFTDGSNYVVRVKPVVGVDNPGTWAWSNAVGSGWYQFKYEVP